MIGEELGDIIEEIADRILIFIVISIGFLIIGLVGWFTIKYYLKRTDRYEQFTYEEKLIIGVIWVGIISLAMIVTQHAIVFEVSAKQFLKDILLFGFMLLFLIFAVFYSVWAFFDKKDTRYGILTILCSASLVLLFM